MNSKPSTRRRVLRDCQNFENSLNPLSGETLPLKAPENAPFFRTGVYTLIFDSLPKKGLCKRRASVNGIENTDPLNKSIYETINMASRRVKKTKMPVPEISQSSITNTHSSITNAHSSITNAHSSITNAHSSITSTSHSSITNTSDFDEVALSYNKSNTPKYVGKFTNVMVNNRLKRQCKFCSLQYMDLKGFNRHYESKHSLIQKRAP